MSTTIDPKRRMYLQTLRNLGVVMNERPDGTYDLMIEHTLIATGIEEHELPGLTEAFYKYTQSIRAQYGGAP